ncbi:MAG: phosphoserine phosphatase [Methanosarcinales archaeon]|nr:phosphoserine phosphatase [ANME-2 cluster archaeon]MDW7774722.1 phosphoserine phosphatase [Methanosarcinales archaeon]
MNDVVAMSENELKNIINVLNQQVEHKEQDIKDLYQEMKLHNRGANELRKKRDELNQQVKELKESATELRTRRDEVNKKIAELKKQRDDIRSNSDGYTDKISELKKIRDNLNKIARGRLESLTEAYRTELEKFSTSDIPLDYEQSLMKRLSELGDRLKAIQEANTIHNEMGGIYGKVSKFHQEIDTFNALIHDLASESQSYHEDMLDAYNKMDEIRKKSDEYHRRLLEIYEFTNPIKEKIDAVKNSISQTRDELDVYLDQMKEIQLVKDQKNQDEKRVNAKDKFQKKGKLSLEDLRLLMENDEIEFVKK